MAAQGSRCPTSSTVYPWQGEELPETEAARPQPCWASVQGQGPRRVGTTGSERWTCTEPREPIPAQGGSTGAGEGLESDYPVPMHVPLPTDQVSCLHEPQPLLLLREAAKPRPQSSRKTNREKVCKGARHTPHNISRLAGEFRGFPSADSESGKTTQEAG